MNSNRYCGTEENAIVFISKIVFSDSSLWDILLYNITDIKKDTEIIRTTYTDQ